MVQADARIAEVETGIVRGELHVGIGPGNSGAEAFQFQGDAQVFRGRVRVVECFGRIGECDGINGLAASSARIIGGLMHQGVAADAYHRTVHVIFYGAGDGFAVFIDDGLAALHAQNFQGIGFHAFSEGVVENSHR